MTEKDRIEFDNNIDLRMNMAMEEERKRLHARDIQRRKKRARRKAVLLVLLLVAVIALITGICKTFSSDMYSDKEEFIAFADKELTENQICMPDGETQTTYSYSKDYSTAVRLDKIKNEDIEAFRERKINAVMEAVNWEEATSLIIDSETYKTGNGALSMVIHSFEYKLDGRKLSVCYSDVQTFLFNPKTGELLEPLQVLNVNYKDKAADYASNYIVKTFNDTERSDNYKAFIKASDENFNKFVMTGEEVVFLFDPGTIVDDSETVAEMPMTYMLLDTAIRPEILDRYIDKDQPMVALTYDDGPGADSEKRILDCLNDNGCVATFFYLGNRVSSFSDNAVRAVRIGCEIGNHSWDHPVMSELTDKQIVSQITKTNEKIKDVCNYDPVVARPPYGDFNKNVLKNCNMAEVLWTVDTKDWDTRNAKKTFKVVKNCKNLDGKIILMHSIYDETAAATEKIVPWLKENGYQTVTVSELIKYKTGKTPVPGKLYRKLQ